MQQTFVIAIVLVAYIIYMGVKQKDVWKKLSLSQTLGVLVTFIGVIGIGSILLYFGIRVLISFSDNEFIRIIIQFFTALVTVIVGMAVFNVIVRKITNGLLPNERERR